MRRSVPDEGVNGAERGLESRHPSSRHRAGRGLHLGGYAAMARAARLIVLDRAGNYGRASGTLRVAR
jgi:hypothetical protein